MLIVEVGSKDSLERALKKLKKKFDKTGVVKELRKRKHYSKKSEKRREEVKKAIYVQSKYKTEE